MTLIGCRCTCGDTFSRALLIARTVSSSRVYALSCKRVRYVCFFGLCDSHEDNKENEEIQVAIASGFHLFPFRTEKLSPTAPMVLPRWESRSLPFWRETRFRNEAGLFFVWYGSRSGEIRDGNLFSFGGYFFVL